MKKTLCRYIPLLQFAGGLNALIASFIYAPASFSLASLPILFLVLIIFGFGVAGGVLLWKNLRLGATLSIVHHLLIIPIISIPNLVIYALTDIISINAGKAASGFRGHTEGGFKFGVDISLFDYTFYIYPQIDNIFFFQVNLLSLIIIVYLLKQYRNMDRLIMIREPRISDPKVFD